MHGARFQVATLRGFLPLRRFASVESSTTRMGGQTILIQGAESLYGRAFGLEPAPNFVLRGTTNCQGYLRFGSIPLKNSPEPSSRRSV